MSQEVTLIFDIGRKYKRYFLFDQDLRLAHSYQEILPLTQDEDGFPCEDIHALRDWILEHWNFLLENKDYKITGVNAVAYGASIVHLDEDNQPLTPLYSPFKLFPPAILKRFYDQYGSPDKLALQMGSSAMGMLNTGLQMYKLKYLQPELYKKIKLSVHLPQYVMYLLTGRAASEYTTLGGHSMLWNYEMMDYHEWIRQEGFDKLLPPVLAANSFIHRQPTHTMLAGFGLHSATATLIPYRKIEKEPFILVSAGMWCVNFNLFNTKTLTTSQLIQDCQHYMTPEGSGVKATRIYIGGEHDYQVKRIAQYFKLKEDFYKHMSFDAALLEKPAPDFTPSLIQTHVGSPLRKAPEWMVSAFSSAEYAYHHLLIGLADLLINSLQKVQATAIDKLYLDGGFAQNTIFRKILAHKLPKQTVYYPENSYASALGAAIHITRPAKVCYSEQLHKIEK